MFGIRGAIFPGAEAVARGVLDAKAALKQQGMDRYATSKLCNILFTFEMARRVPREPSPLHRLRSRLDAASRPVTE
jgi:hypothetical protein